MVAPQIVDPNALEQRNQHDGGRWITLCFLTSPIRWDTSWLLPPLEHNRASGSSRTHLPPRLVWHSLISVCNSIGTAERAKTWCTEPVRRYAKPPMLHRRLSQLTPPLLPQLMRGTTSKTSCPAKFVLGYHCEKPPFPPCSQFWVSEYQICSATRHKNSWVSLGPHFHSGRAVRVSVSSLKNIGTLTLTRGH